MELDLEGRRWSFYRGHTEEERDELQRLLEIFALWPDPSGLKER